jgi:tRNA/rRNA methyltransferase
MSRGKRKFEEVAANDLSFLKWFLMLANCRVVLIRPHYAGNLGSTARLMRNFGLTDLVLVDPFARINDPEAVRMATHGLSILTSARTVGTLQEALADCQMALATSALTEGILRDRFFGTPDDLMPGLVETLPNGPCALVFGPEPSGMTNEEVCQCHGLLHIPTASEYESLNLSMAVGICLYELHQAWRTFVGSKRAKAEPMPELHVQEKMFEKLREGLEGIHFLYGPKADLLMHAVRYLISRAKPRDREVRVLFGLARQLNYVASRWNREGAEPQGEEESGFSS